MVIGRPADAADPDVSIVINGKIWVQGNAVILNGALNITDPGAVGLISDVPNRNDFVANGQRRGWHDWDGFHNPPPPPAP